MRIEQIFCQGYTGFKEAAIKKYGFRDITDPHKPIFFLGCNSHVQVTQAMMYANLSGLVVIYWAGTDALTLVNSGRMWHDMFLNNPNVKHIAASWWIAEDLDKVGLPYYRLPILFHDNSDIKPLPLGDSIYTYNIHWPTYDGYGMYPKIKEVTDYKFIEARCKPGEGKDFTFNREELLKVYESCFLGLRLTGHDGLSETVCELGLMGRRVIHNGDTPNCIHYTDLASVIDAIGNEYRNPCDPEEVSKAMREYLDINNDWLNTEFYG